MFPRHPWFSPLSSIDVHTHAPLQPHTATQNNCQEGYWRKSIGRNHHASAGFLLPRWQHRWRLPFSAAAPWHECGSSCRRCVRGWSRSAAPHKRRQTSRTYTLAPEARRPPCWLKGSLCLSLPASPRPECQLLQLSLEAGDFYFTPQARSWACCLYTFFKILIIFLDSLKECCLKFP